MYELLSTTSHGNDVKVYNLPNEGYIRKIGTTEISCSYIRNEFNGLNWYIGKREVNPLKAEVRYKSGDQLSVLDVPVLQSYFQVSHLATLNFTYKYLIAVIDHYAEVWPSDKVTNAHGDLTLANILFSESDVFIIDWEHFIENELPIGFDIVYLIFSALILPHYSRFKKLNLPESEIVLCKMLLSHLGGIINIRNFYPSPLQELRRIIRNNTTLTKIASDSPQKLFPLLFKSEEVLDIDRKITEILLS